MSRIQSDYSQPDKDKAPVSSSALIPVVEKPKAVVPAAASVDVWKHLKPPKRKAVVLEEEEYVDTLEHIVTRDYFPSLLPATPDPSRPKSTTTPSLRPGKRPRVETLNEWEEEEEEAAAEGTQGAEEEEAEAGVDSDDAAMPPPRSVASRRSRSALPRSARDMTLTEFALTHTSEDNQAFQDLQEKKIQELKEKYFWYQESANKALRLEHRASERSVHRSLLPVEWRVPGEPSTDSRMEEEESTPTATLSTWKYRARNQLMYAPTGDDIVQPSVEAYKNAPVHLRPEIVPENTRFPEKEFSAPLVGESSSESVDGGQGIDDRISVSETGTPRVGGYRLLRTPSPSPHRGGATPVITYGGIVGTPRHLGALDSDPGPLSTAATAAGVKVEPSDHTGVRYRVPQTPDRDQLAWKLGEQARKSSVRRAQMYTPTPRRPKTPYTPAPGGTPSRTPSSSGSRRPRSGSGSSVQKVPLSEAARKLLERKRKTSPGFDEQLRAAYRRNK